MKQRLGSVALYTWFVLAGHQALGQSPPKQKSPDISAWLSSPEVPGIVPLFFNKRGLRLLPQETVHSPKVTATAGTVSGSKGIEYSLACASETKGLGIQDNGAGKTSSFHILQKDAASPPITILTSASNGTANISVSDLGTLPQGGQSRARYVDLQITIPQKPILTGHCVMDASGNLVKDKCEIEKPFVPENMITAMTNNLDTICSQHAAISSGPEDGTTSLSSKNQKKKTEKEMRKAAKIAFRQKRKIQKETEKIWTQYNASIRKLTSSALVILSREAGGNAAAPQIPVNPLYGKTNVLPAAAKQ